MTRIMSSSVRVQCFPQSISAPPAWLGEAALLVRHLGKPGVLDAISEQVRLTRRRFGHYSELTLAAFYERLRPWANVFMALFGRDRLPSRSALSR